MDYTWLGFAIAAVLWMVLALLWERRCKDTQRELKRVENKCDDLMKENIKLKTDLFIARVLKKANERDDL